ncbi:YeeE/YedE family protein, partial [Aeromonas salmonicida]
ICPGPALSLISSGQPMILLFVASMVAGILLVDKGLNRVWVKVRPSPIA